MRQTDREALMLISRSLSRELTHQIDLLRQRSDVDSLAIVEAECHARIVETEIRRLVEFLDDIGSIP